MLTKNRGMLLETLINKTIKFYEENNIAIFHKKNLDITFKKINKNLELKNGVISKKSTVDYYGVFNGKFVCFEAKSTNDNFLSWSNIKEHQLNYLKKIHKHQGLAFFIILLKNIDKFFLLFANEVNYKKEKINLDFLKNKGFELDITYPGIIDFIEILK
ncbi:Holliday junction resolvase RecU [Mesomycoplasma neurolyticum]|uniref:Holliday junction resolvase RecU n=1 Tax=Mesomycoplasma neurolyticum TaxID=2120 RepID=A0A449A6C5_9BACT|nr:Holliday junction resolvase RecU [Mesomycoplasma neurolyticum]VEU59713.1 Holliday junction-specific endonuclease [Mesomycoplasma neurolyticum]